MNGYSIRSGDGVRPVASARPPGSTRPRFTVHEADHGIAVRDRGEHAFFATESRGVDLVGWLNALDPTREQLDAFLGDGEHRRFLRRLGLGTSVGLRRPSVCFRCGLPMRAGLPAFWHSESKLVRHVRSCPRPGGAKSRRRWPA
jgi:hypothetical protein